MSHNCQDHNVKSMGASHIKPYREMYCHDCEREFIGKFTADGLVEYGGKVKSIF